MKESTEGVVSEQNVERRAEKAPKHFGTDGIRKKATEFSPEFLATVARGLVEYGGENLKVLLAGDTRESSEWILAELARDFEALGVEYASAGVLPTPAINYCFLKMGFDFAIDVTASHNPYTDNGIKIFERGEDGEGQKLSERGREIIEKALEKIEPLPEVAVSDREDLHEEALAIYEQHLLDYVVAIDKNHLAGEFESVGTGVVGVSGTASAEGVPALFSGLKIGMDCANGATSVVKDTIFRELGAEVTVIHADASYGTEINHESGSTHLESLQELVRTHGLDFGVAFDGDGDRCLLVDNTGEIVDGDQIIALLSTFLNLKTAAVTVMSNQGLFEWAKNAGVGLEVTAVGDANVAAAMKAQGIMIGGEQSGHIILPGEATGDGLLTALVVSKAVVVSGQSLRELSSVMPRFPQVILNMTASPAQKAALKTNEAAKEILLEFGRRFEDVSGRLLVRPSGTENLIRITAWGKDLGEITALAEELKARLEEVLGLGA